MKKIFLTILLLSLILPTVFAAEKAKVEAVASVAKGDYFIGSRIRPDVTVSGAEKSEVVFPEPMEDCGDFAYLGSAPAKKSFSGKTIAKSYFLTIFETGQHVIPPLKIKYKLPSENEWSIIETNQIPLEIKSVLKGNETDIRDIKGIIAFPSGLVRIILLSALAAILVAGGFIAYRIRKAMRLERERLMRKSAHEIAYEELRALKATFLPEKGMVKEYYFRLSDIVRHYLENRFSYRAPEMTTEEFLNYASLAPELNEDHKKLLGEFLTACDMVKFAKYGPTPLEMIDSFKAAEDIVDQTRFVEEEAAE